MQKKTPELPWRLHQAVTNKSANVTVAVWKYVYTKGERAKIHKFATSRHEYRTASGPYYFRD